MSLFVKLLVSLLIGAVASTLTTLLRDGTLLDPALLLAFCLATVATALLVSLPSGSLQQGAAAADAASDAAESSRPSRSAATAGAARENGKVKWFNASKGFGFIIKEDGEEIFVHFRSIRGEGRRGLRDGQQVSFVVADSDKGPQAEDVEPIE